MLDNVSESIRRSPANSNMLEHQEFSKKSVAKSKRFDILLLL